MATVPFPWRFELDLDRDNLWGYEFTEYVQQASWSLGMTQPFTNMANDAKATLRVKNTNGEFNPENTDAQNPFVVGGENLLRPHQRCRIAFNRYASRVTDGLIQNLYLNETTGTTASDASAEVNNAVYTGVTLNNADSPIPGYRMPAFDGNDVVNLYSAGLLADFDPALGSLSFWLKPENVNLWSDANFRWLARLYVDEDNRIDIFKNQSPANQLVFWYEAGGTLEQVVVDVTATADPIHIAVTWNKADDRVRVYVDGVQQGADQTGLGTWVGNITPFTSCLGAAVSDGTFGWKGWLSHYRLYDRELTAAEVTTLSGNGDEILFVGWLKRIKPPYRPAGAHTGLVDATLICEGMKSRLERVTIPVGIYEDVTGDQVVDDALRLAAIPPISPGGWLAGLPGYSEAGVTTYAGQDGGFTAVETGTTTFPLLGDKEMTGWTAIKMVTEGERGFFYQQRNGQAVWLNRHNRLLNTDSQATITDTSNPAVRIEYEWDTDVIQNAARVSVNPRKTGGSVTLYELQETITVPGGATISFEAALRDADNQPVASGSLTPNPTYTGATPSLTLTNLGGRAKVTLNNSANAAAATLAALTITGAPIQDRDKIVATAMDAESIGLYGRRELVLNLPALSTYQEAQSIANFEVLRRKNARASVDKVIFKHAGNDSDNTLQLDLTMNDRITLTSANLSHDADHFIIGEAHEWEHGGANPIHETTYYLEPAGTYQFWIAGVAGYSEAGVTTYGGY